MGTDRSEVTLSSAANVSKASQTIAPAKALSTNSAQEQKKRRYALLFSPLWLCLLAAVAIRVWLTIRTHGILDSDEALLGIQAERILTGNFPLYFYGLPYFGSLEAYLVALLFAIFGPSVWALRTETTLCSLALVYLTWRMAGLLADAAKLPPSARKWFTIVATLVAAIPPLYDDIIELRTGGGWIETFVLMLLLLISTLRLTSRWREGASNRELAWRWAGIGFIVGLGLWVYPLITIAILAAAIWIVADRLAEIVRLRRELASEPIIAPIIQSLKKLPLLVTAIPACLLGFSPGILWGATHQWQNVTYIFSLGSGGWSIQRIHTVEHVTIMYGTCIAPRVISGAVTYESNLMLAIHSPLLIFSLLCMLFTAASVALSWLWPFAILQRIRRLAALPVLFGACAAVIFCMSSASVFSLYGCNIDFAGRYATPLALALPFLLATPFALVSMSIYERSQKPARSSENAIGDTGTPPSRVPARTHFSLIVPVLLSALLFLYFGAQVSTYGLTDADHAFQTPYCTIAPANYAPIIAYMQRKHIHYAWATNLLGDQIVFETDSSIIISNPAAITNPSAVIDRIPSYTVAVEKADRPSFLVFVKHGDPHPYLLKLLDQEHVTYRAAFFPSEPGVDVMIVTPLNRTVSPFESKSFDIFYCNVS